MNSDCFDIAAALAAIPVYIFFFSSDIHPVVILFKYFSNINSDLLLEAKIIFAATVYTKLEEIALYWTGIFS